MLCTDQTNTNLPIYTRQLQCIDFPVLPAFAIVSHCKPDLTTARGDGMSVYVDFELVICNPPLFYVKQFNSCFWFRYFEKLLLFKWDIN